MAPCARFAVGAAILVTGVTVSFAGCAQDHAQPIDTRESAYQVNNRGVAELEQYAYEKASHLDEAAAAAAEARRHLPDSPHAIFIEGLIARGHNRAADAAAAFSRVLELDPGDPGALITLGQVHALSRRERTRFRTFEPRWRSNPRTPRPCILSARRWSGAARLPTAGVFPGRYAREGDVRALLSKPDDLFVVARTGDAVALAFADAAVRPSAAAPMQRTFLLRAEGYSKEMDLNSASPDHVLPLPYRGVTAYPSISPSSTVRNRQRVMLDRDNTRASRDRFADRLAAR